jgi:N-acetylated-alpha-linked acidic dipeptidase
LLPPPPETIPPFMNFAPMKNAVVSLKKSAEHFSRVLSDFRAKGSPSLPAKSLVLINDDLLHVSRLFLNQAGLPERPWFKNQVYAPGAYTGYGAKPIAAVREYMDAKKWTQADAQIPQVSKVLENVAVGIEKAAADFERELKGIN